jgi:hypothetical protein
MIEAAESLNSEQMASILQSGEALVERVIEARERKLRKPFGPSKMSLTPTGHVVNGNKSRRKCSAWITTTSPCRLMPFIDWTRLPKAVRVHVQQRLRDRTITEDDMLRLTNWIRTNPEVPKAECCKDLGTFTLAGEGEIPKTFLTKGLRARGNGHRRNPAARRPSPSRAMRRAVFEAPAAANHRA